MTFLHSTYSSRLILYLLLQCATLRMRLNTRLTLCQCVWLRLKLLFLFLLLALLLLLLLISAWRNTARCINMKKLVRGPLGVCYARLPWDRPLMGFTAEVLHTLLAAVSIHDMLAFLLSLRLGLALGNTLWISGLGDQLLQLCCSISGMKQGLDQTDSRLWEAVGVV